MLDAKELRENYDNVKKALSRRNNDFNLERFCDMDIKRRNLVKKVEILKNKQNVVSKEIAIIKREGKNADNILKEMKLLSDKIKEIEPKIKEVDVELEKFLMSIPNKPNYLVPSGETDKENEEVRKNGIPRIFNFKPKAHWEIGKNLDIIDSEAAGKTTGSRFVFYKGLGARLERALINFMLDTHVKSGYKEIITPSIVNKKSMEGTGQLPKFEEDMFKIENLDYFLVPTAEVSTINMHREEILDGSKLPISYCAYSPCFRAEAGAAGRDTRGLIRQHQFNKVELIKFTKAEDSYSELEKLTNDAEKVLQLLKLPYRVVRLCTGDLGFSSAMTYDIEVWLSSYNKYVEISSCSNCEDFQSRRANIKYKDSIKDKAKYPHILNGSGVAIGRTTAAILENYQNEDGTVNVPEVLIPYMMGVKIIK